MEQENDHPSTFLKSARKGVTDWVQQRILEVPRLKQNASSSSVAPSDGSNHFAPEGLRPDNDQNSPQLAADRLCFPVSFLMNGGIRPEQDRALPPLYCFVTCPGDWLPSKQNLGMHHNTHPLSSSIKSADLLAGYEDLGEEG